MKLSDMNTVEMAKALCTLAVPVGNICSDIQLLKDIAEAGKDENGNPASMTLGEMAGKLLPKVVPSLLDKHFDDTCMILSALTGKTVQQIRKQKGMQTINDIVMCFDGSLLDFFKSSAGMERTESQE